MKIIIFKSSSGEIILNYEKWRSLHYIHTIIFFQTYLMQFSGSFSQSVLHLNLSHDIQPMGGVLANPLFKVVTTHRM